jgi:ABC-type nickel/cobalt efflux system permease component RcnA
VTLSSNSLSVNMRWIGGGLSFASLSQSIWCHTHAHTHTHTHTHAHTHTHTHAHTHTHTRGGGGLEMPTGSMCCDSLRHACGVCCVCA